MINEKLDINWQFFSPHSAPIILGKCIKNCKRLEKTDFRGKKKKAGVGVDISNLFGSEVYKKKNFINIIIAT